MDNYVGEIRIFAGNFAPENWVFCKGQLLAISEYDVLYSLIGTTYGGDGQTTFAVPNLQSRVVVGQGQSVQGTSYPVGMAAGVEAVTVLAAQLPSHQHPVLNTTITAITGGTGQTSPAGAFFGDQGASAYATTNSGQKLNASAVTGQSSPAGGGQPHSNIQPVLALNYIIALQGIYPSFD
ncbi:tail fiber protein [Hymenobacter sp. ASUV-10]|uniref:Tail fiber protein n=1 Tax=Hymenobacter aranciens TaxID=3063996 RepID=A0ABT9BL61_9BACT|nr:tail fiber protein [Hymenobacter sp. ASUV-10]MDO7877406.1 tail fiber protein [Hymenobacter sp. ASUV-10]